MNPEVSPREYQHVRGAKRWEKERAGRTSLHFSHNTPKISVTSLTVACEHSIVVVNSFYVTFDFAPGVVQLRKLLRSPPW